MRRIYEAEHITQAHLLRALLEQEGITARVDGEFLQGGIGEIGVAGLIGISVEDHQVDMASRVIRDFEAGRYKVDDIPIDAPDPPETTVEPPAQRPTSTVGLALVTAVVVFLLYLLVRSI